MSDFVMLEKLSKRSWNHTKLRLGTKLSQSNASRIYAVTVWRDTRFMQVRVCQL